MPRTMQEKKAGFWRHLWAWRAQLVFVLSPSILCPLPLAIDTSESKCAYVIFIMAIFWVTGCLPMGITSLLPVILFPFLEIMSPSAIASEYMNDINMLFLGGLMVAIAIEYWNIHKMVALRILTWVGAEPRWLMLGMMGSTWFLSMWISNTATTAMMLPITEAILVELEERGRESESNPATMETNTDYTEDFNEKIEINGKHDTQLSEKPVELDDARVEITKTADDQLGKIESSATNDPHFKRMAVGLMLSICYAANCGGIASLTGTGPNLVLKRQIDILYESHGLSSPISFGKWMTFGLPTSFIMLMICWCWLQIFFLRCRGACSCCHKDSDTESNKKRKVMQVIRDQFDALGSLVCGQVMVIVLFLCLVVLWITRDMGGVVGWGKEFKYPVKDGAAAILVALLLFAAPSTLPFLRSYGNPSHPETDPMFGHAQAGTGTNNAGLQIRPLLNWEFATHKFPWNLILLMGGGFAISAGCKASGLSPWIGEQLTYFSDWNQYAILFIICYITACATEFASNTAMTSIMMPILERLALSTQTHPLRYMLPACIAASFAFMLPVATPPNAIVFATGRVKVIDMIQAGFMMNILAVPALVGMIAALGDAVYDFDNIPAQFLNMSTAAPVVAEI